MEKTTYTTIAKQGLWTNNPGLVQMLGLCSLLAVTNSLINGLSLGLATTMVLIVSNVMVSLLRKTVSPEVRIPVFVLIIASTVTVIELAMHAYFYELHKALGIFIPLIVTNCAVIGRAEAFASKNSVDRAFIDGLTMGLGFTGVMVALGGMRELVGQGTLLSGANLLFGEAARELTIVVIPDYPGFLLALLPPGAFLGLGLLIALKNIIDNYFATRTIRLPVSAPSMEPAA